MAGDEQQDISMSPALATSTETPQFTSTISEMQNPNHLNPIEDSSEPPQKLGHKESTEDPTNNDGSAGDTNAAPAKKSLGLADELTETAKQALKEKDYAESVDCFSQALEIRVSHFGELAPECMNAYFLYGQSLLFKAQEEADPIGIVPKKEENSANETENSNNNASINEEVKDTNPKSHEAAESGQCEEEGEEDEDDEEATEQEEDETDLDMAWKMLDIARAIAEKQEGDTMEKVEILSSLAEAALEREDIESSLSDYQKALSILQNIVEPDCRHVAELQFRISLCHELNYKFSEAIPHCEKALDVCKQRIQRLKSLPNEEAEIETLSGLSDELEKKLEDLQHLKANPRAKLAELIASVKDGADVEGKSDDVALNIDDVAGKSEGNRSGVMDLGVVGRGVKRVVMSSANEVKPSKKPHNGGE